MSQKYITKPVVVEAIQYKVKNLHEIKDFMGKGNCYIRDIDVNKAEMFPLYIKTLDGDKKVSNGDYVVKGVRGEFYPCKPNVFKKTHEKFVCPNNRTQWEYEEFADAFGHPEAWLEFLNKKGSEGWELISFTEERFVWDDTKLYRKCLFKRKIEAE